MFPIGIMSILTVYLATDGVMRTSIKKTAPPAFETEVKRLFQAGDYVGAYAFCRDNKSPLTNVLRVGISLLGDGKTMVEEGMVSDGGDDMIRTRLVAQRLAFLFLVGCFFFNYPLLSLFASDSRLWGIPLVYVYLFVAWAVLIGAMALIIERRDQ